MFEFGGRERVQQHHSMHVPQHGAGAVTGTPDIDPDPPTFQSNRVDVLYTFAPPLPIPASIFPMPTFHRMVEMRGVQ